MKKFWYKKEINSSFDKAIDNLEFLLIEEWFWILHRIDMQSIMKKKIDKNILEYIILWVCNPNLASEFLDEEYEMWLLLPCNIIVYKKDWKVIISTLLPTVAINMIDNKNVLEIAKLAEEKLKKIINKL